MRVELPKAYDPKQVEKKIYKLWEESGFFAPEAHQPRADNPNRNKTFTIILPPPNITGELHMGHALNTVIQDILVRKKRMEGFKTLWVPGTDHAGIATQAKVEKELRKEGLTRFDLGREKFIERVWAWREHYGNKILGQLKSMGASCDWSRTRFTMDESYKKAVEAAFLHYYKKGWIYQGEKAINWCTRCGTSLSDLEVEYKEEQGFLYYIKYGPLTIVTVRPETKLGDTAVAVNPKDPRYKEYIGKTIDIQTVLGPAKMKVISDESVDMNFGTGAMKVTPAHDLHDFELGEKYGLEKKQVIGPDGRMTKLAGKYAELTVMEAREKITEDMKEIGILEKVEPHTHNVARCYRCNSVLEPILSKQWFLKMNELAGMAIKAVKSGKVKFVPKKWERIYFDWLKNIKDWCISRQLWWGHKIPIDGVEDVLDTWFSSALWPFATLGWPQKIQNSKFKSQNDLATFYPTNVLSTARDIINLWVARMIFSGMEFMGREPFSTVLIHPTVLTKEGRRMSKSLGTGIDPILLIEKYGADATRFGIAYQLTGGQDIKFTEDNIVMGRKFCNKLWNASRFVLLQINENYIERFYVKNLHRTVLCKTPTDRKIINALNKTIKSVNKDLDNYQFGAAAHTLYDFFWHDFCDKFIEESKTPVPLSGTTAGKQKIILLHVLITSLKLLHPFIPFITEEIYQNMPIKNKKKSLMIEVWPSMFKVPL